MWLIGTNSFIQKNSTFIARYNYGCLYFIVGLYRILFWPDIEINTEIDGTKMAYYHYFYQKLDNNQGIVNSHSESRGRQRLFKIVWLNLLKFVKKNI